MTKLHLNIDMWDSHSSSSLVCSPYPGWYTFFSGFLIPTKKISKLKKHQTGTNSRDPPLCAPVPPPPVQVGSFSRGGFRIGEHSCFLVFRHVYRGKKTHIPVLNHLYIFIFIFIFIFILIFIFIFMFIFIFIYLFILHWVMCPIFVRDSWGFGIGSFHLSSNFS